AITPVVGARGGSRGLLSVSSGPNPAAAATIPGVAGLVQAAAATALRRAGFKPLVLFRKTTNPSKDGLVLEQQPVASTSIPRGSLVAIFVGHTGYEHGTAATRTAGRRSHRASQGTTRALPP